MLKKTTCKSCNTQYDLMADECPNCHLKNEEMPKEIKAATMIPLWKQIALFFTGWLGFQLIGLIVQLAVILGVKTLSATGTISQSDYSIIVNGVAYSLLITILCLISFRDIRKLLVTFKKSYVPYVAGVVCLLAIFAFNIIYGNIMRFVKISVSDNANETSINNVTEVHPYISLIVFGFIGPICEELTYRVGLFSLGKRVNRWVAYLITIIVFALIHFEFSAKGASLINELLNLPYYAFAAFALSWTYEHYGFAGSVTAHVLNNVVSLTLVSIIK